MKLDEFNEKLNLFEMANLKSNTTNLPVNIYISPRVGAKHGPRIKVQSNYSSKTQETEFFSITIENEPRIIGKTGEIKSKDLDVIKQFVVKNKEALLEYWHDKIDTAEVILKLEKI